MNKNKNKKLIFLLSAFTFLFLLVALYLVYFQLTKASSLNEDPRNARNFADDSQVARGTIYDVNGNTIAYSEKEGDNYVRKYTCNYLYSNIVGYSDPKLGKMGIEAYHNADLLNITDNKDLFTKIDSLVDDTEVSDLYLTLDNRIQEYLYGLLGDKKGTIIVTKPKTGEVVGMVSKPAFNVNQLRENWTNILESSDAVLLNRATQGLYEPGSIFKVLSSVVFLRSGIDLGYTDNGTATIADYTVSNYNGAANGNIGLEQALNTSSNTYYFDKSQQVPNKMFTDTIYDFGIGRSYKFPMDVSKSIFPFRNNLSDLEKANAAYGQGETYVTPMDMMLVAMGIANDGRVNKPYIVKSINRNGIDQDTRTEILSSDIEANYARTVRSYMESTATYNGYYLSSGRSIAGKTGTAETDENMNLWFMGMAPADDPEYAIIVLVENDYGLANSVAAPIATTALDYIFYIK